MKKKELIISSKNNPKVGIFRLLFWHTPSKENELYDKETFDYESLNKMVEKGDILSYSVDGLGITTTKALPE